MIYFFDFNDLGTLIIIRTYLGSISITQDFILLKFNEMAECRNLIANNGYIGKTERDLLKF